MNRRELVFLTGLDDIGLPGGAAYDAEELFSELPVPSERVLEDSVRWATEKESSDAHLSFWFTEAGIEKFRPQIELFCGILSEFADFWGVIETSIDADPAKVYIIDDWQAVVLVGYIETLCPQWVNI